MILVDSSVWIDRFRGVGSLASARIGELVDQRPTEMAISEPIEMELLSGAKAEDLLDIQLLISTLTVLSVEPSKDYVDAASIFRSARSIGRPIRKMNGCLIAAVALRHDAELWHKDGDFESIAVATRLRTVDLRG